MGKVETYKNEYNRQKYDRVGLMLPKGKADEWKALATEKGLSLNAFIIKAVNFYTNYENVVQFEEKSEKP